MRSVRTTSERIYVPMTLPFDPHTRKPDGPPKGLILLLHGYDQSGTHILRHLGDYLPKEWAVVSPNAPFPIPHWDSTFPAPGWRQQKLKLGYTWYFYQSSTKEYFLDMKPALDYLKRGVSQLGFADLPKIVIGFSQGGYVAPFIANELSKVRQVVCLSCEFLPGEMNERFPARIDAIFGDSDPIADIEPARASHAGLLAKGVPGEFHVVAGAAHEMPAAVGEKLAQILQTI